jgi:uncharacterized protein
MTVAFAVAVPMVDRDSSDGRRPVIESPCNRVCTLDPASGLCLGCGRSLAEIARWPQMSDAERAQLIAELGDRRRVRRPVVA